MAGEHWIIAITLCFALNLCCGQQVLRPGPISHPTPLLKRPATIIHQIPMVASPPQKPIHVIPPFAKPKPVDHKTPPIIGPASIAHNTPQILGPPNPTKQLIPQLPGATSSAVVIGVGTSAATTIASGAQSNTQSATVPTGGHSINSTNLISTGSSRLVVGVTSKPLTSSSATGAASTRLPAIVSQNVGGSAESGNGMSSGTLAAVVLASLGGVALILSAAALIFTVHKNKAKNKVIDVKEADPKSKSPRRRLPTNVRPYDYY